MDEGARTAPVSAIVPCYRCAGTIERAVRSVSAQLVRPAELILVDDASRDGTPSELDRLRDVYGPDWIRVIRLSENAGPASARNVGWGAATQRYVAFLDADDAWHPRKIEIQYAWMEAHPEIVVSGHAHRQLSTDAEIPADPGADGAHTVVRAALYTSNPFITPSVMLRRDVPQRFEAGKRHMEDYLLWLEIATAGGGIARLDQALAYTFKAPFGETGLSAQAWAMERGELAAFATLRRKGNIGSGTMFLLSGFSLVKFFRRVLMLATGYSPSRSVGRPNLLYVGAYLLLTQAMTALLVIAGLTGHTELAADIGMVQAATLATFFAFSGNARNLILTDRASVSREAILAARLALLLPLGAAATLLCTIAGNVEVNLVLILVARRGIEWIGELHLSESELLGRSAAARGSLQMQMVLLAVAAAAVVADSSYLLWALMAWALVPAFPLAGIVVRGLSASARTLREGFVELLPYIGATAASGMSLYAFRLLLVLVAGKAVAGELFAAFAVGSFPGSVFANVLGPTVSLHQERVGRSYLPKLLWSVTTTYLFGGVLLLGLHFGAPGVLAGLGRSALFWTAMGWSLLGGVVMIMAQRVRLKLIAGADGRDLFGADVLMHVYLIAAIPTMYAVGQIWGLALLYLLNAALALMFYEGALRGRLVPYSVADAQRLVFGVTFLVFLPMFFMLSGHIFNPPDPVVDSGGIVRTLPLPLSLIACSAGLLLLGNYARATPALWSIFGLLLLMLISTAVVGGDSDTLGRAKMLLLLQILLPTFGLVLGSILDPLSRNGMAIRMAIVAAAALVVPAQLLASWLDGSRTLRHSVFLFGVYQHLQFVPVIVATGYLVAVPGLWSAWGKGGRAALVALLAFVAVYAVAAHSVLAMFAVVAGTSLYFGWRILTKKEFAAAIAVAACFASFASYVYVVSDTYEFRYKFSFLFSPGDPWPEVGGYSAGAKPRLRGGWNIVGLPAGGRLLYVRPSNYSRQATLVVEGELERGELSFMVENEARTALAEKSAVGSPGSFSVEVPVNRDAGDGDVVIFQREGVARGTIRHMQWRFPEKDKTRNSRWDFLPVAVAEEVSGIQSSAVSRESSSGDVRNVVERFADWRLFGHGIFESERGFFFGHAKPLSREQRTSAHNFYIDFVYNFGFLALLPLLALIAYTGMLMWQGRRAVLADEALVALAIAVAFLVLVECNLKVSLRQPYPGIAIYFLWGLLIARLRELRGTGAV